MRLLFLVILIVSSMTCTAQSSFNLIGTWNIAGFGNEQMFIDPGADSIGLGHDTDIDTATLNAMKCLILANVPLGQFVFLTNGRFIQKSEGKIETEGTYTHNTSKQVVVMKGKRNGIHITETFNYRIVGAVLLLTQVDQDGTITYKLERAK